MSITLTALQKQRTDTAANWTSANPTLLSGELGFESDTGKVKLGTGSTAWNSLGYLGVIPSSGTYPLSQLIMPLGTAGAPPLTFVGDVNTGIYSPGADQVSVSTGGTERLRIDSTGQIEAVSLGTAAAPTFTFTGDPDTGVYSPGANQLAISTGGSQRTTIDSSGRLLVGTSSVSTTTKLVVQARTDSATGNGGIALQRGSLPSGADQIIGVVQFTDDSQNFGATISAVSDGSWTSGSNHRSRLQFSTTADGASSPTERLRITSAGLVGIGTSSPNAILDLTATAGAGGQTSVIRFGLGATAESWIGVANSAGNIIANSAQGDTVIRNDGGKILLSTDSGTTAHAVIDSSGRVGIGTTPNSSSIFQAKAATNSHVAIWDSSGTPMILGLKDDGSSQSLRIAGFPLTFTGNGGGGSEAVRIDSSGRLLLGTSTSPSSGNGQYSPLVVQGYIGSSTGEGGISIQRGQTASSIVADTAIGFINFNDSAGNTFANIGARGDATAGTNDYPGRLVFSTTADGASSPTERMRIQSTGRTGTYVSASDGFQVSSNAAAGTTYANFVGRHDGGAPFGGTISLQIWNNGNVQNTNGSYTTISDAKLKENIVDADSQWDDFKAIQIRNWNFKAETGHETHRQIGPIAQELETVCPGLVFETPDRDEDGNETGEVTKGVNQSVLYMKAVKALQEAMERIETLEAKVAALESA